MAYVLRCSFCGRQFQSEVGLLQHLTSPVHNFCLKIEHIFQTPNWREQHRVLAQHACTSCRMYFTTSEELKSHSCSARTQCAMTDDLRDSLSTIRNHYKRPLVSLLRDIQESQTRHLKSAEFIKALDCLCIFPRHNIPDSKVWSAGSKGVRGKIIFERCRIDAFKERQYVALSYTWDSPLHSERRGKYYVQLRKGLPILIPSQVRDSVLERARKYMVGFKLNYLWIDRECIMQEDVEEKETAVQAMDLVYSRSKHPVGLLSQPTLSIAELELLAALMEGRFVERSGPSFKLSSRSSQRIACETLALLQAIVSDTWWTRAWTYQENYRGSVNMKLLIPHCISSEDYHVRGDYVKLFGDIPGEVVLNSAKFHEAATAFCLASHLLADRLNRTRVVDLVLERAGKYTLLLGEPDLFGRNLGTRSMSPTIIRDLEKRRLKFHQDRLPIIANCCRYPIRLDSTELLKRRHSISLSILALFLLNGEILYNGPDDGFRGSGEHNVTDFLNAQAFDQYSPPQSKHCLTYNRGCRFIDVELTAHGVRTPGHLWKLGTYIDTSRFPRTPPYPEGKAGLRRKERDSLILLANELLERRYLGLYNELCEYLGIVSPSGKSFSMNYLRQMAKEVATAIGEGKLLRLATLWNGSARYKPYRGIFVCNQSEPNSRPCYVFTASREKVGDDKYIRNDIDRHVSLEVDCIFGGEQPILYTRRWIHGLCFFHGCRQTDVTFPWPTELSQI
ncbi:heterokaryon incompatibility protein-domain-containing protein [Xylaria intraflava]|nr:heterokaryon incompatibility protein-domain-containing protein [Xylaria intraflava]